MWEHALNSLKHAKCCGCIGALPSLVAALRTSGNTRCWTTTKLDEVWQKDRNKSAHCFLLWAAGYIYTINLYYLSTTKSTKSQNKSKQTTRPADLYWLDGVGSTLKQSKPVNIAEKTVCFVSFPCHVFFWGDSRAKSCDCVSKKTSLEKHNCKKSSKL